MSQREENPLLDTLIELCALDHLPRTGWILRGVPTPESLAGHSMGTALLALALGPKIEPGIDVDRAVSLCLLHDVGELSLGDIPKRGSELLPEGAKPRAETRAIEELLAPLSDLALERGLEFLAQDTREARFARLCDKLQLGVRLLGYVRAGQRGLEEFRTGLQRLDASEFEACEGLQRELLAALAVAFGEEAG